MSVRCPGDVIVPDIYKGNFVISHTSWFAEEAVSCYLPSCAAKSWSLPLSEKTISATSASQSTASSRAFLARPRSRFEKVTCRLTLFSIRRTTTLPRPRPISGCPAGRPAIGYKAG